MQITNAEQTYLELINHLKNGSITKSESALLESVQIELARNSFKFFCYMIRPYYKWMWFHKYIMERLQSKVLPVTDYDQEYSRYLLRMGDQSGKTELSCRLFPAWCLGKFPNKQILFLTYSDERAKQPTRDLINVLIDPIYKKIFPEFMLVDEMDDIERQAEKSGQKLTNRFFTNANSPKDGKQGLFLASSLGGSYLGNSGDIIICDDLFAGQKEANSQTIRDSKWELFSSSVLSRQQKDSAIIVVGTWWNRDDIIGRLQDLYVTNEQYLEEGTAKWELTEFNSQKDDRDYPYDPRKYGDYLWPEERMKAYLDQKQTNPIMWQIKHQNLPVDSDGVLFKVTSFRIYDLLPTELENMKIIITIDSNYKVSKTSDSAGITVWAVYNMNAYLLEYKNKKYTLPQLLEEVVKLTHKYPKYFSILVEVKSQGQPFVDMAPLYNLSRVEGFEPQGKGSKWERAHVVLPIFDAGQVHLPNEKLCTNINFLTNQFLTFTGEDGRADDLVDSATQMFMHYDYLFRGAPVMMPMSISRNEILRGNLQRLKNTGPRKVNFRASNNRFGVRH